MLQVESTNPNLPVIEIMQQFTLDAIAASGNASMTDAQKWALNHFFYEIGAISENSLWDKINMLLIPMLATPAAGYNTYLVHDYKSDAVGLNVGDGYITGVNGGLEVARQQGDSFSTTIGSPLSSRLVLPKSAAVISMYSPGKYAADSKTLKMVYIYNDRTKFYIGRSSSASYFVGSVESGKTVNMRCLLGSNIIMSCTNIKGEPWDATTLDFFCYDENGNKINRGSAIYPDSGTYNDHTGDTLSSIGLNINSQQVFGLIMSFTSSLTDEESAKVCAAALELRSAFTV